MGLTAQNTNLICWTYSYGSNSSKYKLNLLDLYNVAMGLTAQNTNLICWTYSYGSNSSKYKLNLLDL